jgi:hypothetical protein
MSIKDLFNNKGTPKIQGSVTSDEMVKNVESQEYVEAKRTEFEQFVPPIDFVSASNFAKFGSAELYYEKAFERIYDYYPYDGTLAEITEFHNSSSYLDKHVFDNLYPRTNGYVVFNETTKIDIFGGPHTASAGMIGKTLESTFDSSMIYDEAKRRDVAFEYKADHGCTIEFWLKKDFPSSTPVRHRIVDMTNSETGTTFQLDYLRDGTDNLIQLHIQSGSTTTSRTELMTSAVDGTWHHYAFSIFNENSQTKVDVFKDGQFISNKGVFLGGTPKEILDITAVSNGMQMTIGGTVGSNLNRLSGSMDEFRFWKARRTSEQIYNSWFTHIGGGTNKNDANLDLGLYYKFNEGITGDASLDGIALDYSGRINNGTIAGYASGFRNTGSAITEKLSEPEFLDPIIYSAHPDVVAKKAEYKTSGSLADLENSSTIFGYFPSWMQEEDDQSGSQLKYLAQVMGSYFDTLWHQINFTNRIHDNHYISGSNKALPFAKELLYDRGFVVPDLFVDATITENLLKKDDNEVYDKQINEVRNTIYHNLYNNLETIYKSKGTEKSFRNFFRSLGIGQDVVKLNMYADDSTFVLRNNYEYKSYERKYLNFNCEGNFDATLFQTSSANNLNTHLPGDTNYSGSFTLETELILPRKNRSNEVGYLPFPNLSASVAGFHSSGSHPFGYTSPTTDYDISIYAIKEVLDSGLNPDDSHRIKFMVTGSLLNQQIFSPTYSYQYENNKWNLALRLRHENYPYGNVTGNLPNNYVLEFYGVEADGDTKRNSFHITTSSVSPSYFASNKIFYAGAHRENFSGSSTCDTDIKLGQVRYWHSNLSNNAVDQHAYDSETFGTNEPFENDLVNTYPVPVPREKTLSFYWAFNNLTGSSSSGELAVPDLSSGSTDSNYGPLSDTIQRYIEGKAIGLNADTSNVLDKVYIQTARKRLPDNLMSSDLTTIKAEETEQFFVDDDVSDNFYSFEKSMYGTISDEMMNMFSTALDLNNLIGQPNQRYHHRYNLADFLRDRFYDDVENEPDIEKFTSFYKWIDDSISIALQQLIPASTRFSEKINNVIESHVLERNKYVHQVPILTTFQSTEGSIKGVSEMKYDWQYGHAPFFPEEEQTNALWQRDRKEKSGLRETLRISKNNNSIQTSGLLRREIDGSTRISDIYAIRRFSKLYDLTMVSQPSIHGGVNFERQKNIQLFHEAIAPGGALGTTSAVPQNIITIGVGDNDGIVRGARDDDNPPRKKKYSTNALVGKLEGTDYGEKIKGNVVLPLNIMSGNVHTGYAHQVKAQFAPDVLVVNLHHDNVGNYNETSIQGPFTNAHVGGLQYRHIDINKYDSSKTVDVGYTTGGTFPSGSIEFTASVLLSKLSLGTGSYVTVRDGDGTIVTANYSNVYDLYDNQWTDMDELVFILNNKLNLTTDKRDEHFLALTQSVTGNFYNYQIQSASHGFITASGFDGGSPLTASSFTRNLDGPGNRPEGWGLVFKDHPSQGDEDGSFGFIGADYATPYPSPVKLKATRYREETAKRPVNIRNIKTLSGTQKAGNYSNEIQIFSTAPEHQKTWAIEASNDPNIDILPPFISTALPNTTNYQTLMGIAPFEKGNIFGGGSTGNRQPDTESLLISPAITGVTASSMAFNVLGKDYVTDSDRIDVSLTSSQIKYEINLTGTVGAGNVAILTGSSDLDFYNNLRAELTSSANSNLGVTYTTGSLVRSQGLWWSRRNATYISATGSGPTKYPTAQTDPVSISMWLQLTGNTGTNRIFYIEESVTSGTDQRLSIKWEPGSGGRLRTKLDYNDGSNRNNYYDLASFSDYFLNTGAEPGPNHFIFTYDGGVAGGSVKLYINGVSSSWSSIYVATGTGTANRPDGNIFLGGKVGSNDTITGDNFRSSSMDEVYIINKVVDQNEVDDLYNGGLKIDPVVTGFSHLSYGSNVKCYLSFDNITDGRFLTDGEIITDVRNLMNFTASVAVANTFQVTAGGRSIIEHPPSASFVLSGSSAGDGFNGDIEEVGTSFTITDSTMINGVTPVPEDRRFSNDNVIQIPSTASQYTSERNIRTRFSAPGGPEIQTDGYLDAHTQTYSAHNAMPFRNLSVLGSGSGESGTIRVVDHLGHRRGLKTLRTLHMGQFGIDSTYGSITSTAYPTNGSFNKQHRNRSRAYEYSSEELIITGSNHDNMHINSSIPRSEFQYSWIRAAVSGSNWENGQRILGFAPKDGVISSSAGWVEAIVFPTASTIIGSE